jgi:Zn-dependent peptidase ImmA (M78 family)
VFSAPTLDDMLNYAASLGITVCRAKLCGALGLWDNNTKTIWIDSRLADKAATPVLAHELLHVQRGDDGHQSEEIEQAIEAHVAFLLVDPDAYAAAEAIYETDTWAISEELDLPQWVIEAYERACIENRRIQRLYNW